MGMVGRCPLRQVLLPGMLERLLDCLMDIVERELVQIDLRLTTRDAVQLVLIETGMDGR